ncbi:MAG: NAD(P)H-quinone oxidoreductase [Kordiimonadaceae bacterium]|nr:NAD(P)H-quinone oxidoreductase [Kordiimonadaceae bacterium]MBO6567628.1 NAD(P)H-quinone oxidoreductase [Kordiimonadaceae bacterium]MBO6963158.1 NAD(P)H-quinone oxidoreductase [Kordiimonadaceae bacterium]
MKAVEITKPGGPEVLVQTDRPEPIAGSGEVLIEVKAAGVNRPDVVQRLGLYPPPPGASDIPGLEVAGVVAAVGEGVTSVTLGDKVCALVPGGGYAELCTAPAATCVPMPEGLSFIEAAALPETYFTVWSNVFDRAGLSEGETFLVHGGSSGIGSTSIQLAKAFGATVITTAGSADKAEFCKSLGADLAINYRETDFEQAISDFTDGAGVNVVLDMVGGDYLQKNINILAPDGRHVSIAFLKGPAVEVNMMPVMLKRLVLTGSTLRPRDNAFKGAIAASLHEQVWPLLESGAVKPIIDTVLPLANASDAHQLMESSQHMGKIVLEV